ncbi:MAG: hypothetical protein ACTHU0_38375 [Kofleriaceae bacterium]
MRPLHRHAATRDRRAIVRDAWTMMQLGSWIGGASGALSALVLGAPTPLAQIGLSSLAGIGIGALVGLVRGRA